MTPTGEQESITLLEPGLYFFINRSNSPMAEPFQEWLCEEVLPSIRRTGGYSTLEAQESLALPPDKISGLVDIVLSGTGINPMIVAGFKANEIGKAHPECKELMESVKKLLPLPVEQELLTVTDLAKKYVAETGNPLSKNNTERGNAIALNKLLTRLGLQVPNSDGNPSYLPTELGKSYSQVVLQEGKDSNKTCQQLRWYPKVIERLA